MLVTCLIQNVQYVPDLTYGLLLCKALDHWGFQVVFEDGQCKIICKDGTIIAKSLKETSQLYFLNEKQTPTPSKPEESTALVIPPLFDLVHRQLAHPGKDTLKSMIRKGTVLGLDGVPDDSKGFDCDACVHGKMIHGSFQVSHDIATEHLG